jgi:toxin CptA
MQRHYKLRPSRSLLLLLILLCAATLVAICMLPLSTGWSLALAMPVLVWGGYCLQLDANLGMARSCVAFRLEDHDGIVLVLRNGRHFSGRISSDTLVTPYIVILNVVLSGLRRGRSLLIMPDTMGKGSFRRLRVMLKWADQADQSGK